MLKFSVSLVAFYFVSSLVVFAIEPDVIGVLETNEVRKASFFRTDGNVLMMDTDISDENLKDWESALGPMPLKKQINVFRTVNTLKLKKAGLDVGMKVQYFNFNKNTLESFTFSETSTIMMYPSAYFDPEERDPGWWVPFESFGVLMSHDKKTVHLNKKEFEYNGLGYIGNAYELVPNDSIEPDCKLSPGPVPELAPVIKQLKKVSYLKIAETENPEECTLQGQKLLKLPISGLYVIKLSSNKYGYWKMRPGGEFAHIEGYGVWIKGSLLSFIYDTGPVAYLITIYPDKVEKIELYHTEGYKG